MLVAVFPICTDFGTKANIFRKKKAYAHDLLIGMNKAAAVKNLDGQDLAIFVSYTGGETKGF